MEAAHDDHPRPRPTRRTARSPIRRRRPLVTGGGPLEQTYTDTGAAGTPTATAPPTVNDAVESAYPQNPSLNAAFAAVGIKTFGSDSSKPYPSPATATFLDGGAPTSTYANGSTFTDSPSQAIGRGAVPDQHLLQRLDRGPGGRRVQPPVPARAQGGKCVDSSTTTCETTPATFADIVKSVDTNMFQHVMGNDPRPHYFHQPNMMGTPPAGPPTTGTPPATSPSVGDGLFYSVLNPLLNSTPRTSTSPSNSRR